MNEGEKDFFNIETLEKIDELQNMMRDIDSNSFDEILEISSNLFALSKEVLYSYFTSLRGMAKSRGKSKELYIKLGNSIIERCPFLSKEDRESEQFCLLPKTINKTEIKSNTDESESIVAKLAQSIIEDNVAQFQIILSHNNLNLNSELIIITSNEDNTNKNSTKSGSKDIKEHRYALIEYAALNSSINVFKFLILNLEKSTNLNDKLFNYAIQGGNFDIIHLIEKEYPQMIKESSLHHAISTHQNQVAQYLLENFDTIQLDNKSGMKSVKSFNIEFLLKYLNLIKGKESDEQLNSLFTEAIKTRQLELAKFLFSNYSKFININSSFYIKKMNRFLTPLIYSIKSSYNEIFFYLIRQKNIIIFQEEDEYEPNPLNEAIKVKNHQIVEELLKLPSIQVNELDFNYYAPIHYSIFVKDFPIFLMIVHSKSADTSLRGGRNETIFHYAACNSFIEVFDYFLENYPDKLNLTAKNIYGILS